jgi:hypothetical protein
MPAELAAAISRETAEAAETDAAAGEPTSNDAVRQ